MLTAVQFGFFVLIKRRNVFMMPCCTSTGLRLVITVALYLSVTSFAEQQLLCFSDSLSVWWEYEGPVVLTSVEMSDCTLEEDTFSLTYTGMPLFTMVQLGWHLSVLYKNETLCTLYQPLGPCEDFRICDLIKGERIHESTLITIKPYFIPNGEYQIIGTVNIIDDFDRELTVTIKSTVHMRKEN